MYFRDPVIRTHHGVHVFAGQLALMHHECHDLFILFQRLHLSYVEIDSAVLQLTVLSLEIHQGVVEVVACLK